MLREERIDERLVPDHQEADPRMALQSQNRARNHDGRTMVPAHRIERNTNWFWHEVAFLSVPGEQRAENSGLPGLRNRILRRPKQTLRQQFSEKRTPLIPSL
jgi:hypothetical protein